MKSRKLLLILLVVVLLVVYYIMGTAYQKQGKQQELLNYQIADGSRALAQAPRPPDDLEQRLAAAQANLAAAEGGFPTLVNSTQAINSILKLADAVGVKAIPLITRPWSLEKTGDHDYYVLRLNVSVTGRFPQLAEFTDRLEKDGPPTLIIKALNVSVVTPEQSGNVSSGQTMPVSADLDLAIYTRSPLTD